MPPPLSDGQVKYDDGSPETLKQYSEDISAFLMWAAEPHMVARKRIGFQVIVFLIVLSGLLYFTKKKVWSRSGYALERATTDESASTRGPRWGPFVFEQACIGTAGCEPA